MLRNDTERYLKILMKTLMYIVIPIILYFIVKFSFKYFMPFVIAILFSIIIEPPTKLFQKLKLSRGLSVILSMIIYIGGFICFFTFALTIIIYELGELYNSLPAMYDYIYNWATNLIEKGTALYLQLPPEATNMIKDTINASFERLKAIIGLMLSRTPQSTISFFSKLSGTFLILLFSFVATFFITKDKKLIKSFILRQLSPNWRTKVITLKDNLFLALVGFLKAQMILLSITFLECYIGLTIIGIDYAFIIALLIAFVDILPVLGTGSVYVPWAVISFILGDYKLGVSLLILYGVIVTVRYIVEPKIVGKQLGIHPVVALVSMFAGLKLLGVVGVILGPTIVVIIKACQQAGIIAKFK